MIAVTAPPDTVAVPVALIPPLAIVTPVGSANVTVADEYPEPPAVTVPEPTERADAEVMSAISTLRLLPLVPAYLAAQGPTEPSPAE